MKRLSFRYLILVGDRTNILLWIEQKERRDFNRKLKNILAKSRQKNIDLLI